MVGIGAGPSGVGIYTHYGETVHPSQVNAGFLILIPLFNRTHLRQKYVFLIVATVIFRALGRGEMVISW